MKWLDVTTDGWGNLERQSQTWRDRELITVSEFMQLPERRTLSFIGNLPPLLTHRVDYCWFGDKVAEINRRNEGPPRLTRPAQQAVTYAPASLPEAMRTGGSKTLPTTRLGKEQRPGKARQTATPARDEAGSSPDSTSRTPPADSPRAQESSPKKKRARARKRKETGAEQADATWRNGKAQGRGETQTGKVQTKPTFENGLEAAVAAFWERGGEIKEIKPCGASMTSGGMPYEVYTDGKDEVAVCEVRETRHYFIVTLEELGLENRRRHA